MFRNPRRPRRPGRIGPRQILIRELEQAHHLLNNGHPDQAARIFARLAHKSIEHGRPRMAANLHTQAAMAWLSASAVERANHQAQKALVLFNEFGMRNEARIFKRRFDQHLKNKSHNAVKESSSPESDSAAHLEPFENVEPQNSQRHELPAECEQCGGPVRSDKVEWVDPVSAVCLYCGAILKSIT